MKYLFENEYHYLDKELYEKECQDFLLRYDQYLSEFEKISSFFPKQFVKEYARRYFHDYDFVSIKIEHQKKGLDVVLVLQTEKSEQIRITLQDAVFVQNQLTWEDVNSVLYVELLPLDNSLFSLELSLCPDEKIIVWFHSILYQSGDG